MSTAWAELLAAAEKLARARSFDDVVDVVRGAARRIAGAEGVTFVRWAGDHCDYVAEDAIEPLWAGQSFPVTDCISGWVMRHGEPAVIPDIDADDRIPAEAYRDTFVRSLVMVPVGSPAVAAIGAYWATRAAPGDDALHLLTMLARHVDAAISNIALQTSLEILNRTGTAVAAEKDLDRIVQLVTDAGVELTGAEFGAFFYNRVDERGESYMLYALSGASRAAFERFPMPRNTPIFSTTFAGEGVVRSDNIRLDPRYGRNAPHAGMPEGHLPVSSYLAVPVVSRSGEVHGGLFFGHHREARFTAEHERLLLGIAGHAATAIDNARLHQSAQSEIEARATAEAALKDLNATLEQRIEDRTREISEAFARLADSEEQFRILVDGVTDYAIYMLDAEGRVTNWNAGAQRIKGYSASEIVGAHFSTFYTEEDRARGKPARTLETATRTGRFEAEGLRQRKDGSTFWASVVVDAIRDKTGTLIGFAKVTRDLTEKRGVEEQLRQSQKMEAVGQLTGGIAHDFNNLLTVITGNIDIAMRALETVEGAGRAQRTIGNAMKGAERAAALTQRLLAFSRRQPLSPKQLDLDKVVAGVSDLLKRSLGELVRLEIVTTPGLWRVEADPNQIESALLNLAVNARDAMPDGGTLTIETANARLDDDYSAAHSEVPPGNYVVIAVSDTGSGMPKAVLARVFEPFFTTKETGRGTGLGLSQVYGFVKQSGGHVSVYSEEGSGTTVKMYLPRYTGEDSGEEEQDVSRPEGRRRVGETILVVEDDDEVRAFSIEALRELGYTVLEATDGAAALRLIERPDVQIDLLFTDVVMPGMSGKDLSDEARTLRPSLRVLYTSGYTRNSIVHGGRLDPGVALLPKPFTLNDLSKRVRDVLESGSGRRLLVAESDSTVRVLAIEALVAAGFQAEQAANAAEAMGKLRAAQGRYDALILDSSMPEKNWRTFLAELRRLFADVPVLVTVAETEAAPIGDPRAVFVTKPYGAQVIVDALAALGMDGVAGAVEPGNDA